MKFQIIQDTSHGWQTWRLVNNAGGHIASSDGVYETLKEAQDAIKAFKVWVQQAPVQVLERDN